MNKQRIRGKNRDEPRARSREDGTSLIELMIAMTLGLLVVGAMTSIFINNSQARRELDKSAQQLENGRYAIQLLRDEISQAGFYDALAAVPGGVTTASPCSESLTEWKASMGIAVEGVNGGSFPCVSSPKSNTGMIFVQRASTAFTTLADRGAAYLQVSLCGEQYVSTAPDSQFKLKTPPAGTDVKIPVPEPVVFNLQDVDCKTTRLAPVRQYLRRIFFIDRNNVGADGIPTLKRVQFGANQTMGNAEALVEGIDDMHFEYAIDTDANGSPDLYSEAPSGAQLPDIVGVRVWLIARAIEPTPGYTDGKTYKLGTKADYTPADRFKRHVYSTYIEVIHPVARRTK